MADADKKPEPENKHRERDAVEERLARSPAVALGGVTLASSFVSTLFRARRAAKIGPVVALKYE